jgi:hypothetical protein
VPGDLAAGVDRPDHARVVRADAAPVLVERRAIAARKDRHRGGLGVGLLLVEDVDVGVDDPAQPHRRG